MWASTQQEADRWAASRSWRRSSRRRSPGDFAQMTELIQEYATDDFVEEWPQSGERLTKEASLRLAESYPEMSGTKPTFTYRRMLGGGDIFVIEGTIDYGDGIPVSYVGVGELREDKVARMTEYFANPFGRRRVAGSSSGVRSTRSR